MTPGRPRPDRRRDLEEYLRFARDHEFLDAAEELRLIALAQAGDREAMGALVVSNMRFVATMARRFCAAPTCRLPQVDACQEGAMGLMRAVREFDPGAGVRLKSYARFWIMKAIRGANPDYLPIRVPAYVTEPGRAGDVGAEARIRSDAALRCRDATAAAGGPGRPVAWEALFGGGREPAPDAAAEAEDQSAADRARILAWLGELPGEQEAVVTAHYGLGGREARSLKSIGEGMGESRQNMRHINERALRALARIAERAEAAGPARGEGIGPEGQRS